MPASARSSLLKESTRNHLGKLAFRWMYWNVLLPGRPMPLPAHMSMAGKHAARADRNRRDEEAVMPVTTIGGRDVHVDDEGFLTDYDEWNEELGAAARRRRSASR